MPGNKPKGNDVVDSEENLSKIGHIYTELLQVSGDFLRQIEKSVPSEEDVVGFREHRGGLLKGLQPLVEWQRQWLAQCDRATLPESIVQCVDAQLEQMRQLEDVNAKLMERVALCKADFDKQIGEVRIGKKALSGYGQGPKKPPRFCRGSV